MLHEFNLSRMGVIGARKITNSWARNIVTVDMVQRRFREFASKDTATVKNVEHHGPVWWQRFWHNACRIIPSKDKIVNSEFWALHHCFPFLKKRRKKVCVWMILLTNHFFFNSVFSIYYNSLKH